MTKAKAKAVANRFLKAFIFGALSATTMVAAFSGSDFGELQIWLKTISFVLLTGGINGVLMALQKWVDWQE